MKPQKTSLLQAWPIYFVCVALVATMVYVAKTHPARHGGVSLSRSIAKSIAPDISKLTDMQSIIDARRTWNPVLMDFYGKKAPDFPFTDITGAPHRLSNYLGKNLIIVLWATWSQGSFMETAHLIQLRDEIPADSLEIIAFSSESAEKLSGFAAGRAINYTIASYRQPLPPPFCPPYAKEIPSSFYIDRNGTITLAVEGLVPYWHAKAILKCISRTAE